MRVVCLSDTHEKESQITLPEGDMLIHAGDLTTKGSIPALAKVASWFKNLPFRYKIIIAGNHDWAFQNVNHDVAVNLFQEAGCTYLQDSGIEIEGIKFWGAPWQPWYYSYAFNLHRGAPLAAKWALIPDDTNVLITHGPCYGILDSVEESVGRNSHQGCEELAKRVKQLQNLKLHVAGHLHKDGSKTVKINNVIFVNAAICTEEYKPTNQPVVIDL